jgi:alkylation response protein AidB-like acyl-CoA dehydrogenase
MKFVVTNLPKEAEQLRSEVRKFLAESSTHLQAPNSNFSSGYDIEFSRKLGARGWLGMSCPKQYGGSERSFFERFVITEELLSAGAPVAAHWIADRQTIPFLLRFGTEAQKLTYLPKIISGETYFSIGMSEPDAGSDLAAIRTKAERDGNEWVINGTKIWTTDAHLNHFMVCLVRTRPQGEKRHEGLSQLIIDLKNDDCQIRPIKNMAGHDDFNEVVFENTRVPADRLVGTLDNGWSQVTSELSYERSGPERYLSSYRVFVELIRALGNDLNSHETAVVGKIAAHLKTLRRMSISIAGMLDQGQDVTLEAAVVKELGNRFELELPKIARLVAPRLKGDTKFRTTLEETMMLAPSFPLRGGSIEIMRGVIARGLGLR